MRHLDSATDLTTDDELRALYEYPEGFWLRANFVASIDGAASVDGLSGGLGTPSDKRVFDLLRELADVVLVGAGTAREEGYRGARISAEGQERRIARGQSPVPPIAVVSARASIDPTSPLLTDTSVPPIVFTLVSADTERKALLRAANAQVVEVAGDTADIPPQVARSLAARGLRRVLCEGGPSLLGQLLQAGLVDELCLTTAPVLAPGPAPRIIGGDHGAAVQMERAHTIAAGDGAVFTRWIRRPVDVAE